MDTPMSESRSTGTQTSNKRARLADAAEQVGQGLQVTVPRNVPHLFNNTYTVKLSYADNYRHDIAQNGGASAVQTFRMNSIFDPDITGTGHQPLLRDLWASQYDYYAVLECEYKIRMYNAHGDSVTYTAVGTSAQKIGAVNVSLLKMTTNSSDYSANGLVYPIAEQKNVETRFLIPEDFTEFSGTLTQGDFILDAKDSDSDPTWTAVGSNPSIARSFGYVISPAQYTALVGVNELAYSAIQVQVLIDYTVQFTQLTQALRVAAS